MTTYVCSRCKNGLSRVSDAPWYIVLGLKPSLQSLQVARYAAGSVRSSHNQNAPLFSDNVADASGRPEHRSTRKRGGRRIKHQADNWGEDFLLKLFNENTQATHARSPTSSLRARAPTAAQSRNIPDDDKQPAQQFPTYQTAQDGTGATSKRPSRSLHGKRQIEADPVRMKLTRYMESKDLNRTELLWREVQKKSERTKSKVLASTYDQFLLAFLGLGHFGRAIEVWNHRAKEGVAPSIATWDAMLRGAGLARDANALNEVWAMMLRTGAKPDKQMWATKVHGLATMGHWRTAFETFEEMALSWLREAQAIPGTSAAENLQKIGDVNGVLKPDTRTLNALLGGLARANQSERVASALSLADSLGIAMDVYSFNSLLLLASKSSDNNMLDNFLAQMRRAKVKPDTATYTILLDSVYRGEANHTQETRAAEILNEMSQSGIEANSWVYSTLIKSLLKSGGNIAGAQAVLDHMDRHNIPVNTHIFTAFATYHFEQSPPDMAAIETVWNRALSVSHLNGSRLDVIFFDRLIEGFAKQDEIGKATIALAEASKRGIVPGWLAMTELLRALARVEDWSRMRELVAEALGDEIISRSSVGNTRAVTSKKRDFGRQQFLEIAQELGLLDGASGS